MVNKKNIIAILIITILAIVFLGNVFFHPTNVFINRDHVDVFLYNYNYKYQSFQEHNENPLWDTHKYSGMYSDVNTPHFYPFDFLFLFSFEDYYLNFIIFIHLVLAGVFMYFFARSMNLNEFSSLVSAAVFMFSGRIIVTIGAGLNQLIAISLIPLIFWMFNLVLNKRKLIYSVLLGIAIGLQLLSGAPQYFFLTCLGLGLYFLFSIFPLLLQKKFKNVGNLFGLVSLAVIIGLCLSAVYLIPSLEFTSHLSRVSGDITQGAGFEYAASAGSLPPAQLITALMPYSFGNSWEGVYWGAPEAGELYFYLGIFPLILSLVSLLFVRNKYTMFFFGLAIFALLFALGKYTPFFYLMYKFVPGVSLFRIPSKIMALYSLSIAVLAGFGANYLSGNIWRKNEN